VRKDKQMTLNEKINVLNDTIDILIEGNSNDYVVKHDFRKFSPSLWGANYKKPFGDENQGRLVKARNEDEAKKKFAKKYRLNSFYLTVELATTKNRKKALPF
jgi:hypothetical protein